ncbi:hypothetical protein SAMN04487866_1074 [Thermoactinomyces sp. DSM 45891]|uniref:hypothetical protein n=1 Tax=Thermoactinomyces sp. DSM 45891 TaxID=1761907 RepID=UPI00091DC610|nr:hypothetical protein [Thermoactinomyces sp. DSM 45891]SFX41273.1 hypothetical protein SAMN04487866_1074 [Thermoactinomyces sp. DSM 45891]
MKKIRTRNQDFNLAHENVFPLLLNRTIEKKRWPMAYEQKSDYQISSTEPIGVTTYRYSLSKRRLLKFWEQQRKEVRIAPFLPEIIQEIVFKNVYDDMKEMLANCYYEDFHLPLMVITLQSWLLHQKNTSIELDRNHDTLYWEEIIQFLHTCSKRKLLQDLQQQGKHPSSKHFI